MTRPQVKLTRPALIVIDVQRGFDDAGFWGPRNNPGCEANIEALLVRWRERGWPVVLVHHDSDNPASPLAAGQPGHEYKDGIDGPADLVVGKCVNSSFYGEPDLHAWLQREGLSEVVICGITTNHCCETTARMAGNLGYDTYFALDATHTFDRTAPDGTVVPAEELARITATNLDGEFATVVSTAELLKA
ncbi:cysteine hydrolase [Galactobacter valiniphilus]|uniref:Cysteine hydrolase n=1 Tax=Galactobacter valiniphilus TaxID=2676122 RepID=A0A399JBX2_9MICC|nr:cysteine hydrolase family protein [Galactobacter valiniphilus]RII42037.1 cysteine hydrolase [Galactobacter valiniphilus]